MDHRERAKLEKQLYKNLNHSISKDETRRYLQGVVHDSRIESLCSTNGHSATILKSLYNEELKDIILDKNYQIIGREPVKIHSIIPDHTKLKKTEFLLESKYWKSSKTAINIYFDVNEDIGSISYTESDNTAFCIDARLLKYVLDDKKYLIAYQGKMRPILINLYTESNFTDVLLVMPLKY